MANQPTYSFPVPGYGGPTGGGGGNGTSFVTEDTTIYVSTTGDDSNDGLTEATAVQTVQKGVNLAVQLIPVNGVTITVQLAAGTYDEAVILYRGFGAGGWLLQGDTTTPANVIITSSGNRIIEPQSFSIWYLKGLTLQTGAYGVYATSTANVGMDTMRFGAVTTAHFRANTGALIYTAGDYSIVGGAAYHAAAINNGRVDLGAGTVTLTGTPAFSQRFAWADRGGVLESVATFSGGATGSRYTVGLNGVISVGGAGANYFPGSLAGTAATGGQYL